MSNRILVTKASLPPKEEYFKEISDIWESHWLTNMGCKHNQLEKALCEYLKVSNISLFTNGHMALEMVLQSFELKGEVITTPFTFVSTTHAIARNGLKPVFADIKEDDYTLNPEDIERKITKDTVAIVPVHVYGNVCEVEAIDRIAKKYKLKVIYDAAHTFGVERDRQGIAEYGDASILSFHATKVFNTIEGGAVCYHDEKIGQRLYQLKNFGIADEVTVNGIGANAKMNEFQAAMGLCNLRHIEEEIAKRKAVVMQYRKHLANINGLKIMEEQSRIKCNYAYFPLYIDEEQFGKSRDEIDAQLKSNDVFARKYFYPLTSSFSCYHQTNIAETTPVAKRISDRILTLPLYADLALCDVDRICSIILDRG